MGTRAGIEYIAFLQDNNGLGLYPPRCLVRALIYDLVVNTVAVPRVAKQAIGALVKLSNVVTGSKLTMNVEHDFLDSLLKGSEYGDDRGQGGGTEAGGDVSDPLTGYSPYPGNTNQILFCIKSYLNMLFYFGQIEDFVNPSLKEGNTGTFKRPTWLKCMMQDCPKALENNPHLPHKQVSPCYLPGLASVRSGIPPAMLQSWLRTVSLRRRHGLRRVINTSHRQSF